MFEDALEKLKKTLGGKSTDVRKSELDPGLESGGEGSEPDIGNLASEAVVLFETGELQPDIGAVADWVRGKGLPDSDVDEFSSAVIDSYFDDGSGGEGDDISPIGDDDGDPSAVGDGGMDMDEINKSILALKEGQSLLAEGMNKILEKDKRVKELEGEVAVLKSQLSELAGKPAPSSQKTPVTESNSVSQNIQKGIAPASSTQAKEFEILILKGIQSGQLTLEEMTYFETTGKLSENAVAYVNTQKLEGKN
jgi:hypothetical protein